MKNRNSIIGLLSAACLLTGFLYSCNGSHVSDDRDSTAKNAPDSQITLRPSSTEIPVDSDAVKNLNKLTDAESKQGWKLLFNGKDLTGWKGYNSDTTGAAWKVKAGTLMLDETDRDTWHSNHGGDLCTVKNFGNFELSLEFKVWPNTNSGCMLRVQEEKKYPFPYNTGPEIQMLDDQGNPDKAVPEKMTGSIFGLVAAKPGIVRATGSWNTMLVRAMGDSITCFMNGQKISAALINSAEWKNKVANSNFKSSPGYASFKSGKIDFQERGGSAAFRNIKLRELE